MNMQEHRNQEGGKHFFLALYVYICTYNGSYQLLVVYKMYSFELTYVQIVENGVCTLRNLSYRLEVEMPSSRLMGSPELDTLLGFSPVRELDYLCWGRRRRGRLRGGWPDDKVLLHSGSNAFVEYSVCA